MKGETNIAEILRGCPQGTKLYSPLFGKCEFIGLYDDNKFPIAIRASKITGMVDETLMKDGCFFDGFKDTGTVLFPSAEMRDWSQFFKRGDVVVNESSELVVIFDGWVNDNYTEFNTTVNFYEKSNFWGEEEVCLTKCFSKATDEERARFIAELESHYGGTYNPETLNVDAKKERSLEPFQKVLARGNIFSNNAGKWKATFFSHKIIGAVGPLYECAGGCYKECIPYNDETKHMIGTEIETCR